MLIIGSGAWGAAVAWSLAETKMCILCLEQGDWMKSTDYPSNGRDWEARRYGDFDISPNRRGRDTDYPVNDDNSPMKVANFNGVGGGTVIYTAHWPRLHPSHFKVKTLERVADDPDAAADHAKRMAAIERGMEIPPLAIELIDGKSKKRRSSLLPGLVWFFIGLAVVAGSLSIGDDLPIVFGLVALGIGIAYLIYYGVEGRHTEKLQLEHELRGRDGNGNGRYSQGPAPL